MIVGGAELICFFGHPDPRVRPEKTASKGFPVTIIWEIQSSEE